MVTEKGEMHIKMSSGVGGQNHYIVVKLIRYLFRVCHRKIGQTRLEPDVGKKSLV